MKRKINLTPRRSDRFEGISEQSMCVGLRSLSDEDEGHLRMLALFHEYWLNSPHVHLSWEAKSSKVEAVFDSMPAGCEACQQFAFLGLLQVFRLMAMDPCFAHLVNELARLSYASSTTAKLLEPLTDREMEVLGLMVKRHSYQSIADILFISPLTVKTHVNKIFRKLGVNRRRFAIQRAHELGLVSLSSTFSGN